MFFFFFFFILVPEQLLYHVEYFLFILPHLHPTLASMVTPNSIITHFLNVKLEKENYLLWRSQFLSLLKLHDLEGLVDGTFPYSVRFLHYTEKDAQPTINPEYTRWIKLDQMLLCWLISLLTEAILAHVVGLTTSRDV